MENPSGQPCDICGDTGIAEVIATCSKCHKSREHIYCMHPNLCKLPVSWFCEPCQHHSRDHPDNCPSGGSHHQEEVPNLCREEKVWGMGMGSSKASDATETVGSPSCQSGKTMLIIVGDAHALSSGAEGKPVDTVVLCQDHGTPNLESSYKFGEEDLPNPPAINALWKGSLKILGSDSDEIYDGVQAYPPAKVLREAYLVSKEMPQVLHFTLQRTDVWTGIFHAGPPSGLDIALYFWADDLYRESYNCLLELMEKKDLSLVSRLDSKELFIFTSRELPVESQRINRKFYLWGVFHSLEGRHSSVDLKGKQTVVDLPLLSCGIGNDSACLDNEVDDQMVDIKFNIVGGKKVRNADICLTSNSPDARRETSDVPFQDASNKGIEEVAKYIQATKRVQVLPDYGAPPGFPRRVLKERPSVEMRGKPHSTDVSAVNCSVYEDLANLNENVLHIEDMGIEKAGSKEVGSVDICLKSNSPAACRDTYVPSLDVSNQGNEKVALQAIKSEQGDDYGAPPGFSRPILSKERHNSVEMQEKVHAAADMRACENSVDLDKKILHREDMVIEEVGSKEVGGNDYGAPPGFSRPIISKERHDSVKVQEKEHPAADIRACENSVDLDENILHREDMVIEEVGSKKVGGDDDGAPSEILRPNLSKERNDSVEMQEKEHPAADVRACENSVDLDENSLHREDMVIEEVGSKKVGGDDDGGAPGFSRPIPSKERYDFVEMQEKQHSADIQSVNCKACEDSVTLDENILHVEDVGVEEIGSKEAGSDDYGSPNGFSRPILSKEQCGSVEMKEKQDPSDIKSVSCRAYEDSVNLDENIHHIEDMGVEEMGSKEVGSPDICLSSDSKAACWDNLDASQDGFAKIHSDQPCEKKHTETEKCDNLGAPPGLSQLLNIKEKQSSCDLKGQHVVDPPLPDSRISEVSITFNEEVDDPGVEMEIDMAGGKDCGIVDICLKRDAVDCLDTSNIPPDKEFPRVHSYQPIDSTGECDDFNAQGFSKPAHVNGQGVVDIPYIGCRTGEESTNVVEVVDDYVMDMEIDMVGGEEVGIIDIRMMSDSTDESSVSWDTPQGLITTVHSDQLTNPVASHLHQTKIEKCDAGASKLAINIPIDNGPIATSPVGHKLDAPPAFSNSIQMAEGTSSSKYQDHQIASNGWECIVGAQPAIGCFKDLKEQEDEDGLTCMVCKKGYYSKPNDMLGIYSFSKQVKGTTANTQCVYTTVSNFNIIHFQCHREAKRADASLKHPKKEWQGAILRNNGICNSIFPIKSSSVPTLQYVRCVSEYWGNLNKLGCADGSRLQLLTFDLLLMLGRFSTRESFKGVEIERNSRFLPFMIQMGRYLVEQESSTQRQSMSNAISSCLTSCSTEPNYLQLMMVNSLLLESYKSWLTHRPAFLKRGIELAHMQHKKKQPLFSEPVAASEKSGAPTDFCSKPILVYIGLIEQLQRFFKLDMSGDMTSGKVGWEVIMTQKLDNVKELLDFSKKLLVWLDEMMLARKLRQVFKIMGLSSNMDFGRFSNCEDFVQDAIQGSRKKEKKRKRFCSGCHSGQQKEGKEKKRKRKQKEKEETHASCVKSSGFLLMLGHIFLVW